VAYNELLAKRMRNSLTALNTRYVEKKMFGGLAFMVKNKMCCGIVKDDLMVRVVDDRYEEVLSKPGAREMDFTGRPMKGFVFVSDEGLPTEKSLRDWLKLGMSLGLPPRKPRRKNESDNTRYATDRNSSKSSFRWAPNF
jgi:TfoX/Sxy family transcriptional regulator of competence genes